LYINAAEGGHARAQWRLAVAYEKGELNLAIDDDEALKWY
jgi:TPR repeat protein